MEIKYRGSIRFLSKLKFSFLLRLDEEKIWTINLKNKLIFYFILFLKGAYFNKNCYLLYDNKIKSHCA